MENRKCPICKNNLVEGKGELEQVSNTHLPTTTWACECGYKRWEPAYNTPWENNIMKDPVTGKMVKVDRFSR